MGGVLKEGSEGESAAPGEYDLVEEDSPYPEVRASVSNIDDPEMPGKSFYQYRIVTQLIISFDDTSLVSGDVPLHGLHGCEHLFPLPNSRPIYLTFYCSDSRLSHRFLFRLGHANMVIQSTKMARRQRNSPQSRSFQHQGTFYNRDHGQCRNRTSIRPLCRRIERALVWTQLRTRVQHLVCARHPTYRVCFCWIVSAIRGLAGFDDLAIGSCCCNEFEHVSRGR